MKKALILFSLLIFFRGFGTVQISAQENSHVTVKGNELNSGVLILSVLKGSKGHQLQCNQGASGCTNLKSGNYLMVELPANFGMYECKNVEVYPESAATSDTTPPDKNKRLGEYCLIEK